MNLHPAAHTTDEKDTAIVNTTLSRINNGILSLIPAWLTCLILALTHCLLYQQCYSHLHELTSIESKQKEHPELQLVYTPVLWALYTSSSSRSCV